MKPKNYLQDAKTNRASTVIMNKNTLSFIDLNTSLSTVQKRMRSSFNCNPSSLSMFKYNIIDTYMEGLIHIARHDYKNFTTIQKYTKLHNKTLSSRKVDVNATLDELCRVSDMGRYKNQFYYDPLNPSNNGFSITSTIHFNDPKKRFKQYKWRKVVK